METHRLSGDRAQKHEHYLKGSVFCGRCGARLILTVVNGNGGQYRYFRCFGRHNLRNGCDAPHMRVDQIEAAVAKHYREAPWLSRSQQRRVRELVKAYGETKLVAAKNEAQRAETQLDDLKLEQQRLLQLSYKGLVDDEVLATEQARIRSQRAQVEKPGSRSW